MTPIRKLPILKHISAAAAVTACLVLLVSQTAWATNETFTATPTNGAAPLTVSFTAPTVDLLGNLLDNWTWAFGDGGTGNGQTVSHSYTNVGIFNPSLTVSGLLSPPSSVSGPSITVTTPGSEFDYAITSGNTISIAAYTGPAGAVSIPTNINGYLVTGIEEGAFEGNNNLTSLMIPSTITFIEVSAFFECTSLTAIDVDTNNPVYSSVGGVLFDKSQTRLIEYPPGNVATSYTMPDSVLSVGLHAFQDCINLNSVTIGNDVTIIDKEAFDYCPSLIDVIIPSSVIGIGDFAFEYCPNLTDVYFEGNAPGGGDSAAFIEDTNATAYYLPGTSGWSFTFGGIPAVLWGGPNPAGSLQVTIVPSGAVSNGAVWQVDDGDFEASGDTVFGLSVGNHQVSVITISGWTTPADQTVTVVANQTTSATVTYVGIPSTITTQPANSPMTLAGLSAAFTVNATGSPPLSYQWYGPNGLLTNGGDISGANSQTLTVSPVSFGDAGNYSVAVINSYNTTNSGSAVLSVLADTNAPEDYEAGTNYVASGDFTLANMTLSNALNVSPTNADYNFFYAASELLSLPSQPAGSNFLTRLGFGSAGRDIFDWRADGPTNARGHLVVPVTTPPLDLDEFTAQLRTNVLFSVINAQSSLAQIADKNFTINLTTNETHAGAVTVDWGDVQMLQAMCETAELFIYTTYSWNLDVQLATATNLLGKNGSIQAFLTNYPSILATTSTADLPAAKGAFTNAISNYFAASQFIRSRPGGETRLFNLDAGDLQEELEFRETLSNLLASLNGPVTLTTSPNNSVSAQAFFSGSFDPNSYLPQFQGKEFVWDSFPDPTFGGIISGISEAQASKGFLKSRHTHAQGVLDFPGTEVSVLYNFTNFFDQTGLVQGPDGTFYGTLMTGGAFIGFDENYYVGFGSVFKITPNGQFSTLYSFGSIELTNLVTNSYVTSNTVVTGGTTNFDYITNITGYSTNITGGVTNVVYVTNIYGYTNITDGITNTGYITNVTDATNIAGGTSHIITNYYLTSFPVVSGGVTNTVYVTNTYTYPSGYAQRDGAYPNALTWGSDGNLYGTTLSGGLSYYTNFNVVETDSGLVTNITITTNYGYGTVFKITTNGQLTTLYDFGTDADLDAETPVAALVQSTSSPHYLVGTTQFGGNQNVGTIFVVTTSGVLTNLYSFGGYSDGAYPAAPLVQGTNANRFYGTTPEGGEYNYGTIFAIDVTNPPMAGELNPLYSFGTQHDGSGNPLDGAFPNGLVMGADGNFYGTAQFGGTNDDNLAFFFDRLANGLAGYGDGSLFSITPTGTFSNLLSFDEKFGGGYNPIGSLVAGSEGALYGVASGGGANKLGSVFIFNPGGVATNLVWLDKPFGGYGGNLQSFVNFQSDFGVANQPVPTLLTLGLNGNLYGTTTDEGANGSGTVYVLNVHSTNTPVLTWATPTNIIYGTALGSNQLNATANVPGGFAYTPPTNTVLNAGTNTLSVLFTPSNTIAYTTATDSVTIVVMPATPVLTWATPDPITYGTALSSAQLNATANVPGSFAYNPTAGTVLNAGSDLLSVVFTPTNTTGSPSNTVNYTDASTNVTIMVATAPLIVTAGSVIWVIGQPFPVFSGMITGVTNDDNITAVFTSSATSNSLVGTNSITPILADPNNRLTNYTVTINNGTFVIVSLVTSPTNGDFGAYFTTNQGFTFSATANSPYGVQSVALYTNSVLVASSSSSGVSTILTNLAEGGYLLTASAIDSNSLSFTSSVVYVTISDPGTPLADFDPLTAYGSVVSNAPLSGYLAQSQFGMSITNNSPGTTIVAEDETNAGGGGLVSVTSLPNLLTQIGSNGPVSFTVGFTNLLTNFSFTIPELVANSNVAVTYPAWLVQAFDPVGTLLAETNEPQTSILAGATNNVPAQTFTLNGEGIASVEFDSEGTGLTTFNGMLLDDFVLATNSGNLAPAIVINEPTNGQLFTNSSTPISIAGLVAAETGTITGVGFYLNGNMQAGSNALPSPFSIVSPFPSNSMYALTAVVTNSVGLVSTSAPVSITVATGFAFETSPMNETIAVGGSWQFSATTTSNNVTYQWLTNGIAIAGATNSSYSVTNASLGAAQYYAVVATSGSQSITSPAALLTVLGPPSVGSISEAFTTNGGNVIVTLSVMASDVTNFYSQWLLNGTRIPGATSNYLAGPATVSYSFSSNAFNSGNYEVVVANIVASSNSAPIAVNLGPTNITTTNDTLASSLAFDPLAGPVAGNNSNSPVTDNEISTIAGKPAGRFLWYNWTTPSNTFGIISLTTLGSSFDTLLGIYTNNGGTLVSVAEDDDSGGYFTSKTLFNFQSNTTYQIAVAGYKGAFGSVLLGLSPSNNYTTNVVEPVITLQPTNQIAYSNSTVTNIVAASNATTYQWYFANNPVGSNAPTFVITNFLTVDVGQYYVQVFSNGVGPVTSENFIIELQNPSQTSGTPASLAVDKFGDAVDLTDGKAPDRFRQNDAGGETGGFTLSQSFSTAGATKDEGEQNHAGQPGGASYWYTYTAPGGGVLQFDTTGSTFSTILAVYTGPGDSFSTLVSVGAAYTTNNIQPSVLVSNVVSGTKYYVVIDGYLGASGAATLNVFFTPTNVPLSTGAILVTNNPNNNPTIVTFSSPANDAVYVTQSNITVTGTVRAGGGTPPVFTYVQVAVNTNAFGHAAIGPTNSALAMTAGPGGIEEEAVQKVVTWSTNLTLTNGANVITAQSVNVENTNLATVSVPVTRTVFYATAPPSPLDKSVLTLQTGGTGSGRITGQPNQASLEVNKVYKVTAVPVGNSIFTNWTGGANATNLTPLLPNNATLAFLMSSNLILQANFVPNPFTAVAGVYNGLFSPTNGVTNESSGFFTATIPSSSRGAYSARLLLDGGTYPFSGTFGLSGSTQQTVARSGQAPVTIDLQINLATNDDQMTGSVNNYSSNGWNSQLQAWRAAFNESTGTSPNYAGRYTLVIPPGSNAPSGGPGGYGYATLTNNLAGHVVLNGRLGDGTAINQAVPVATNGNIPLYVSLYSRKGSLMGWLTLTNNPSNTPPQTILGTNLTWTKLSSHSGTLYSGGFTNTNITVLGSLYTPGAGISVLTNGTLTISNGDLAAPLMYSNLTIVDNKVVSPDPGISGNVIPGTGVLTLTFRIPGASADTAARGVLLQTNAQTNAAGWFLGPNQSGYFLLQQ